MRIMLDVFNRTCVSHVLQRQRLCAIAVPVLTQVDSFYGSDAQRLDDHLWLHEDA